MLHIDGPRDEMLGWFCHTIRQSRHCAGFRAQRARTPLGTGKELAMHHFLRLSNEQLRKRGYRLTPQRYMILSVIQEANQHLTIEQIAEQVQQRNPYVSLSTVYRTLELLKKLGLVRENHLPGEQPHYEAVEGNAHHHLVCRRCRTTIHLDETLLGNLHEQLQEQYHFHQLTLDLVAAGYCTPCWQLIQQERRLESFSKTPEAQSQQGQGQQVYQQQCVEHIEGEEEIQRNGDIE
ncbi:MAG: transcriptional repressor [Ktedonobacteraceae bacterium]|nr:transcriptional repressor [Ktedonobacteraceae bacterium]